MWSRKFFCRHSLGILIAGIKSSCDGIQTMLRYEVPKPTTSSGDLLEMQILKAHPRPTEAETLGVGPAVCVLTSLPGDSDAQQN